MSESDQEPDSGLNHILNELDKEPVKSAEIYEVLILKKIKNI